MRDMSVKRQTLNFSQYVPNNKVLEKKVPENPRYKHVKPAVDSGKSVRSLIDKLKEQQKNANLRKDEVFKRIKISTFIRLVVAVFTEHFISESLRDDTDQEESEKLQNNEEIKASNKILAQSAFCSVIMGIGEMDLRNERKKQIHIPKPKPEKGLPYLLLDVRDKDEYLQCHIITAESYPSAMLSRSLGYETKELQLYKNNPGLLIILYDDDEATAARVAKTLIERGYENVFLLSGGLKLAMEKFPQGLMNSNSAVNTLLTKDHNFGLVAASPKRCVPKKKFTPEDINMLQETLDQHFCPNKDADMMRSSCKSRTSSSREKPSYLATSGRNDSSPHYQSSQKGSSPSFKSTNLTSVHSSRSGTPLHQIPPPQTSRRVVAKPNKNPPWK